MSNPEVFVVAAVRTPIGPYGGALKAEGMSRGPYLLQQTRWADQVNVNGSGVSLGHPYGATGASIATKATHELVRCSGRRVLVTMCIGGGQGIAAVSERV